MKRLESKGESFKFVGNSSEYVRSKFCQLAGINTDPPIEKMPITGYESFEQWSKSIDEFKRDLFIGRLFEHIGQWDKAKRYYEGAISIAAERKGTEQLAIAKQRLADLYYKQDIWKKEDEAIDIYEKQCIPIYKELGRGFEVASLKVAIANVKRRQGDYKRSKELAEEARKEYRKLILDYARCLNVLGLARLRGSGEELEEALKFCHESKRIKEGEGDKSGIAESENAIALLLTAQGRKLSKQNPKLAEEKFNEAIKHLEEAIKIRIKFGSIEDVLSIVAISGMHIGS